MATTEAADWVDAAEVARRLGVSRDSVLDWTRAGRLPSVRLGHRTIKYFWPDVLAALRGRAAAGVGVKA
jgi:excisionase family DNA binding protein